MKIIIRNEVEKDFRRVEEIARGVFWNIYFPGTDIHFVINRMRQHKDYIKELSFVIEVDGEIEGAIFYSNSKIVQKDKSEINTISFGPVFISKKFQRKGLGKKLIEHSISKAKEMKKIALTTLGYPYHYKPYGFVGGKKYNISMIDEKYYKGLLVLELFENSLNNIKGSAIFSEALESDINEVELFDKSFPFKEKKVEESQKEYEIACAELDE